jgi:hypothetical protein
MPKFAIQKTLGHLPDVQRNYMFELWIPGKAAWNMDEMRIRCRTAVIPQRGNEASIEVHYMGMKQFFPGKPTFGHTLAVNIEEFEDKKVAKALYSWQQLLFDIEENGASLAGSKRDVTCDITLKMFRGNGNSLSDIKFFSAWPQMVGDVTLGYTESGAVQYPVTFQFDRWQLVKPRP